MISNQYAGKTFLQVGATRDGLDAYLDIARTRQMATVLVETPDYLYWRRHLGRRPFDTELPVDNPSDPNQVFAAISHLSESIQLVLPGFERYVSSAFFLQARLGRGICGNATAFECPDKSQQRALLAAHSPQLPQPHYTGIPIHNAPDQEVPARIGYPLVVKPTNGGGGLGVYLVRSRADYANAVEQLQSMRNYDGRPFDAAIVEQFIEGTEYSVQGVVENGHATLLSACEKLIHLEPVKERPGMYGFREAGHIATGGDRAPAPIHTLTQAAIEATGYRSGPFHIDMILRNGDAYFLEMGFRLSGAGLVRLVKEATGVDWASLAFQTALSERQTINAVTPPHAYVGHLACTSKDELDVARSLVTRGLEAEVTSLNACPPEKRMRIVTQRPNLAADINRHSGTIGRVLVRGQTLDAVRSSLRECIATRLEQRTCAA